MISVEPLTLSLLLPYLGKGHDKYLCFSFGFFFLAQARKVNTIKCLKIVGTQNAIIILYFQAGNKV